MFKVKTAIFIGSKTFGLKMLEVLSQKNHHLKWTVIHPDDFEDTRTCYPLFQAFCKTNHLDLFISNTNTALEEIITDYKPDIAIVCGYYKIIPIHILSSIPHGFWGIHHSPLPKYRGGSPLVWQMINTEKKIGSSFFRLGEHMDEGDVLHQVFTDRLDNDHIADVLKKLEILWQEQLPEKFKILIENKAPLTKQVNNHASYCSQRIPLDGQIDWNKSATYIDRFIKAQSKPYPGAYFKLDNIIYHITAHALFESTLYGTPGQVFSRTQEAVTICCGESSGLILKKLELNGQSQLASTILKSIKIRLVYADNPSTHPNIVSKNTQN